VAFANLEKSKGDKKRTVAFANLEKSKGDKNEQKKKGVYIG
jgi:hypothetical protein